ncbi:MAG: hypothetical protein IH865_02840 [Chloroflexi bacterium]|nr:hypothetical protein [Chloroflexota bacterium]
MSTRIAMVPAVAMLMLVACRPSPSDPVEYLHREDAIIIQMLSLDGGSSKIDRALAVPEFTLYGDGTLIYQHETTDGTRLLQTLLSEDAVQELLEAIVDEGFLNFTYDQPAPEGASRETTFLYAHTLDRANAVSIRGVTSTLPEGALDEFDQYRKIQTFVEMLRALDPITVGGEVPSVYLADLFKRYTLAVNRTPEPVARVPEAEVVELPRVLGRGRTLEKLLGIRMGGPGDGLTSRTFSYAPLLPYHENFPEFDLQ